MSRVSHCDGNGCYNASIETYESDQTIDWLSSISNSEARRSAFLNLLLGRNVYLVEVVHG
jgi:hypothetical protein